MVKFPETVTGQGMLRWSHRSSTREGTDAAGGICWLVSVGSGGFTPVDSIFLPNVKGKGIS